MKFLAAALLASSALVGAATAAPVTVNLTGTVDANSFGASGYNVGDAITASFTFDQATGMISAFTVGKYTLSGSFQSFLPGAFTATDTVVFSAQNTDSTGATTGTGYGVNLYYPTSSANTTDLAAFLNNGSGGYLTSTDPVTPSTFAFTNNGAGFGIEATINSVAAPEPAAMALLATAFATVAAARRRR